MRCRVVLPVVGAALAFAAPASAATLTSTPNPLPGGSTFQGGDGNQVNDSGFIDWQQLQTDGRVVHNPDPNAQDSEFTAGKENSPKDWELGYTAGGVTPGKANILDAWSAVDQVGANTFLYFAFTRNADTGTTHLAVELNQDARLWNNGHANIPCRRTGDIVVAYEVDGNDASVILEQWTTTPGDTDPNTGCARSGSFSASEKFVVNTDIQGAMNLAPIQNFLPGFMPQGPNGIPGAQFGEASLNLTSVLSGAFGDDCFAFGSVWMHSRSSVSDQSSMQDYVGPRPLVARTCSAAGTKFFDLNANGARDPGEPGIPRFLIWADYNNDGIRQANEPFSVTDDNGDYVIKDIRGSYRLREMLLDGRTARLPFAVDWTCSFPLTTAPGGRFPCAWGPIDASAEPNATGRDFGNWYPGQLTIRKNVEPPGDPTQFQVNVTSRDGSVREIVTVGDGQSVSVPLPPGTYDVEEVLGPGSGYTTEITCRDSVANRGTRKVGSTTSSVTVVAGGEAECALVNLRPGPAPTPAIQILKTGPVTATAGDTLAYKLYVTNTGQVAFPEAGVRVTDSVCDGAPKLDSKNGDTSPGTLDPDETWTYACSHKTSSGGADCTPSNVPNTGTVTGDTGTETVTDTDTIATALVCPPPGPVPPNPTPPDPQPIEPIDPGNPGGPVEPDGPTPPDAGDSGDAGIKVLPARAGCVRTGSVERVNIDGARIATVRLYANGHFRKTITPRILQRVMRVRVTLAPGRYLVTAHVTFQLGSGTPPVIVARTVRICAARSLPIRFTG